MPRFVILAHDWPAPHWDFLLESGPVLRAWRLLAEPGRGRDVPAEPNFDHRLHYLDHEGPLTGNRGSASRWDSGSFEWISTTDIMLTGGRVTGHAKLMNTAGSWMWQFS